MELFLCGKAKENRGEMRGGHAFSIEFPWNHMTLRKAVAQPSELTVLLPIEGSFLGIIRL